MKLKCIITGIEHPNIFDNMLIESGSITLRIIQNSISPEFIMEINKLIQNIHQGKTQSIEIDTDNFIAY